MGFTSTPITARHYDGQLYTDTHAIDLRPSAFDCQIEVSSWSEDKKCSIPPSEEDFMEAMRFVYRNLPPGRAVKVLKALGVRESDLINHIKRKDEENV